MDLNITSGRVSINEVIKWGRAYLRAFDIKTSDLDADVLFMHASGLSKSQLFMNDHTLVNSRHYARFTKLVKRRAQNVPVAYLTNDCEFYSLPFYIDERVLIPRHDTETIVEVITNMMEVKGPHYKPTYKMLELGTGSGCISIAVAHQCRNVKIDAVDISDGAIEIAKMNSETNKTTSRINFFKSDLFENVTDTDYDFIFSNPPYIATGEIDTLAPDVKDFEPRLALDGGADGLDFFRRIADKAPGYMHPKSGMLFFEIGYSQGEPIKKILFNSGFDARYIQTRRDYAGKERVVFARNY